MTQRYIEMHIHTGKKGFTLIELLVALGLSSIIVIAVITLMSNQRRTYNTEHAQTEAQQAVSRVHGEFLDKIRLAGYMTPKSRPSIIPYPVTDGPDSIKVFSNYDNFVEGSVGSIWPGDDYIYTKANDRWRYYHGTNLMLRKPKTDSVITTWTPVDTAFTFGFFGQKYVCFKISDSTSIYRKFPSGTRVNIFNSYTFKVINDGGTPYFGMVINDQDTVYRLVEGVENITITYETRNDTTDRRTLPTDSLDLIHTINLEIEARSITQDRRHIDPDKGDHYWRTKMYSSVVVLNQAIDRR